MIVLSIDPGTITHGLVWFDTEKQRVTRAIDGADTQEVLGAIYIKGCDHVGIERYRAGGQCDANTVATIENVGRFWQRAQDKGIPYSLHTRAVVLSVLDCHGLDGTRDSIVRQRLYQRFGGESGSRQEAVGTKKAPGAMFGVKGHAMQALAVAVTVDILATPR